MPDSDFISHLVRKGALRNAQELDAGMSAHGGFTLVEVLAAFAIGAVIIAACAALIHNVALNFDRGTRTVDVAERFVLAIDRLSADFASARAVARRSEAGPALAFVGEPGGGQTPGKIVFVAAAPVTGGPPGDEVVMLTVERDEKVMCVCDRSSFSLSLGMQRHFPAASKIVLA